VEEPEPARPSSQSTRAAPGQVLAHGESGSIKRLRVGAEAAEANLRELLKDVYAQAGVSGVSAACCGVASCSLPGNVEWITAVLKEFRRGAVRSGGRRSHRSGRSLSRRPRNPADCRNRLEHHRPRARRQPRERRRL
jgi:hypothetical protein